MMRQDKMIISEMLITLIIQKCPYFYVLLIKIIIRSSIFLSQLQSLILHTIFHQGNFLIYVPMPNQIFINNQNFFYTVYMSDQSIQFIINPPSPPSLGETKGEGTFIVFLRKYQPRQRYKSCVIYIFVLFTCQLY